MYRVEQRAGRLVEVRVGLPFTSVDVDGCAEVVRHLLMKQKSLVFCVDLLQTSLLAPHDADKFVALMRQDNLRVARNGFLMANRLSTVALQMERLLREAGNPARRIFYSPAPLKAWLAEVLTPEEQARLDVFLDESVRAAVVAGGLGGK
jgi:hypothetical protein